MDGGVSKPGRSTSLNRSLDRAVSNSAMRPVVIVLLAEYAECGSFARLPRPEGERMRAAQL